MVLPPFLTSEPQANDRMTSGRRVISAMTLVECWVP